MGEHALSTFTTCPTVSSPMTTAKGFPYFADCDVPDGAVATAGAAGSRELLAIDRGEYVNQVARGA